MALFGENLDFLWECISIENKNDNYKKLKKDFFPLFFECEPSSQPGTLNQTICAVVMLLDIRLTSLVDHGKI